MKSLNLHILALISCGVLLFVTTAAVANNNMLVFEHTQIRIDAIPNKGAEPSHPPHTLEVELLPESTLQQDTLHTLSTLTENNGVMIALDSPAMTSVPPYTVFIPVDVLFIDEDGLIQKIAPNIMLTEMLQSLETQSPIKAILFLKGGQSESLELRAKQDLVTAKIFARSLTVQE